MEPKQLAKAKKKKAFVKIYIYIYIYKQDWNCPVLKGTWKERQKN